MSTIQLDRRRARASGEAFEIESVGEHPIFASFSVRSPSGRVYQVRLRDLRQRGIDACTCPDFRTNGLGTCKHREAVLAQLEKKHPRLVARFRREAPPFAEVVARSDSGESRIELVRSADFPRSLEAIVDRFFDSRDRLRRSPGASLAALEKAVGGSESGLRIGDDARALAAEIAERDRRARGRAALLEAVESGRETWQPVKLKLYPYQVQGGIFLATTGRAVLADDMGLGKTLQAIAAAEHLRRTGEASRVLVVCPASLKAQWAREILRATGERATIVEGRGPERRALYAARSAFTIANYEVALRDEEAIAELAPCVLIFDEAQRLKNWRTKTAQTAKRLPSKFAFVLTGTPLENSLDDLYSIIQLVDQRLLGPLYQFNERYFRFDGEGKVCGWKNLDELRARTAPVVLRRHKEEVLSELPERIDNLYTVPLTSHQRQAHDEERQAAAILFQRLVRRGFLTDIERKQLMAHMAHARRICDSLVLYDDSKERRKEWRSPKLEELARILDELVLQAGEKAVVFTEWQDSQDLVVRVLEELGVGFVRFSGSVPVKRRAALIERFERDPKCRVFLSTDAGGVGLNLQVAGVVVNVDQPWNPAKLEQRVGRIHRLGQERSVVRVVNLVAESSIEEGILALQKLKLDLAAASLDAGSDVKELTRESKTTKLLTALLDGVATRSEVAGPPKTLGMDASAGANPKTHAPEASGEAPVVEAPVLEREGDERAWIASVLGEELAHVQVCGRLGMMPVVVVDDVAKARARLREKARDGERVAVIDRAAYRALAPILDAPAVIQDENARIARARERALSELTRAREKLEIARCVAKSGFAGEAVSQASDALLAAARAAVLSDPAVEAAPDGVASTVALALTGAIARRAISREDVARLSAAKDLRDGLVGLAGRAVPADLADQAIADAEGVLARVSEAVA